MDNKNLTNFVHLRDLAYFCSNFIIFCGLQSIEVLYFLILCRITLVTPFGGGFSMKDSSVNVTFTSTERIIHELNGLNWLTKTLSLVKVSILLAV